MTIQSTYDNISTSEETTTDRKRSSLRKEVKTMTFTSRYSNKYNAFVDSMYIEELCDTNDIYHFVEICQQFNYLPNFCAYVNDTEIDTTFFIYIDTNNDKELDRLAELLDDMTL